MTKKERRRLKRRSASSWLAMSAIGSVVACTAAGANAPAAAAMNLSAFETRLPSTQSDRVFRFDIPPNRLGLVIQQFEATTGTNVQFSLSGIGELPSNGVIGERSFEDALGLILEGTGVGFDYLTGGAIVLRLLSRDSAIEVNASLLSAEPSSAKFTEPIRNIPQTITIIPSALMEQQGATTLRDVLTNVPGITIAAGEGGQPAGDNLTVRGFSARNDIFVDGVRDLGTQSRDAYNLEQVEVSKGPGSVYTGRGSTGGSINLVSKAPSLAEAFSGTVMLGNADTKRITGDVNTPVPFLGERTGFRLNMMWNDSGVPGRDVVKNEKWGVAPSLAFGLNSPTRLTLSYNHLDQDNISDYGIPWVPDNNNALIEYRNGPPPVPRNTFYGFRDRDFERMKADTATIGLEHDFADGVSISQQVRYGHSSRDSVATPPRFAGTDTTDVNREMRAWRTKDDILDSQTHLQAGFATGGVGHAFVTGLELSHEANERQNGRAGNVRTTLLNPDPDEPFLETPAYGDTGDVAGKTVALYAFDTARLGQRWELTGGLRWERFHVDGVSTGLTPVDRVDTMHSVRGGIVFHPKENGSLYLSYGSSLSPTIEGLNYSFGNSGPIDVEPEKTYSLEAGSKWDLAGGRLLMSGAVFRVEKTNARTPGVLPDDPPTVLQGRQRSTGAELGVTGNITGDWAVFGAYTFMDAKVVESNDASEIGEPFANAPRHSGNIWTTYQLGRLDFGGGIRFVGERHGTNAARTVDSFWTADLMASYPIHDRVDLRLNAYNVNDAYYFDRLGGGHVVPGPGRAFTVSTGFRF